MRGAVVYACANCDAMFAGDFYKGWDKICPVCGKAYERVVVGEVVLG